MAPPLSHQLGISFLTFLDLQKNQQRTSKSPAPMLLRRFSSGAPPRFCVPTISAEITPDFSPLSQHLSFPPTFGDKISLLPWPPALGIDRLKWIPGNQRGSGAKAASSPVCILDDFLLPKALPQPGMDRRDATEIRVYNVDARPLCSRPMKRHTRSIEK